jgi:hypothetical protein
MNTPLARSTASSALYERSYLLFQLQPLGIRSCNSSPLDAPLGPEPNNEDIVMMTEVSDRDERLYEWYRTFVDSS